MADLLVAKATINIRTNRLLRVIVLLGASALLSSCSKETPKCSSEETLSYIRQWAVDLISNDLNDVTTDKIIPLIKIEDITAESYDEKIKKYTCRGTLRGGDALLPISYESQLDDDNKHVVRVGNVSYMDVAGLALGVKKYVKEGLAETNKNISTANLEKEPKTAEQKRHSESQETTGDILQFLKMNGIQVTLSANANFVPSSGDGALKDGGVPSRLPKGMAVLTLKRLRGEHTGCLVSVNINGIEEIGLLLEESSLSNLGQCRF